jgi:hypothetical protein
MWEYHYEQGKRKGVGDIREKGRKGKEKEKM